MAPAGHPSGRSGPRSHPAAMSDEALASAPSTPPSPSGSPPAKGGVLRAYAELTKPGVTRLVMITTAAGAIAAPGAVDWRRFGWVMLGTTLVVASANSLNMYIERNGDAVMERTRGRPIPSGRISPRAAWVFGVLTGVVGLLIESFLLDWLTGLVAAVALTSYVLAYTPLKRVTPLALQVGAVPGALPPVIGWVAMTGSIGAGAVALFVLMFVWQLPHFLAITLFRQREYEKAGIRVLPAVRGVAQTKAEIIVYSLLLVAASLAPLAAGIGHDAYLSLALASGAGFFAFSLFGLEGSAGDRWARSLFFASMPHLVLVMGALVWVAS